MSYILDALKKSDRARRQVEVPNINTMQDVLPKARILTPAVLMIIALLLVITGLLYWLIMKEAGNTVRSPLLTMKQAPVIHQVREVAPVRPVTKAVEVMQEEPVVIEAVESMPAVAVAIEKPAVVSETRDPYAKVLLWERLPASLRARLPYPKLDVHVYAKDRTRRFILVNLDKYHESEQLAEGPVIEAIVTDGVVLSYEGEYYKVQRP